MKKPRLVLVLGGARSGKSAYAVSAAEKAWRRPLYVATAEPRDTEMAERIKRHRASRGRQWTTVEAPVEISMILAEPPPECDGIVADCLTLWLSNVLLKEGEASLGRRMEELTAALKRRRCGIFLVSNEVGLGIVPDSALGRSFRDHAGRLNQAVAAEADAVVLMIAGLPLALKGELPA